MQIQQILQRGMQLHFEKRHFANPFSKIGNKFHPKIWSFPKNYLFNCTRISWQIIVELWFCRKKQKQYSWQNRIVKQPRGHELGPDELAKRDVVSDDIRYGDLWAESPHGSAQYLKSTNTKYSTANIYWIVKYLTVLHAMKKAGHIGQRTAHATQTRLTR